MKLILVLLFSLSVHAQKINAVAIDLGPVSKLAIAHLNEIPANSLTLDQKIKKLNTNFKLIDVKTRSEIFEMTLINKVLLNSHIKSDVKNLTTSLIKQTQEKLKANSTILTNFSKEIMNMIIDDYLEYFEGGFLNRYQSFSRNNPEEVKKFRQLKSILKLTSSWIHSFIDLTAKEFNTLCSDVILESIELSIDESYYLGKLTKQSPVDTNAFELIAIKKKEELPQKAQTLKSAINGIEDNILESASDEINSLNTDK